MKKVVYTVSQLSLSGRGKKMWKYGDVVTKSDFPENFNQLIKEGRIKVEESETEETIEKTIDLSDLEGEYSLDEVEEVVETIEERIEEAKEVEESETEETPLFIFVDSENNQRPIFTVKDITKAELQAYLIALEVAFKPSEKEEVLVAKAVEASKKGE